MKNRLRQRVEKLEHSGNTESHADRQWEESGRKLAAAEEEGRQELTPAERELLDEANVLFYSRREREWSEAQREIWVRWDKKVAQAARDGGFLYLDAHDRLL